ncbi:hAT family dimerization protein [Ceratobasidium sp. AG-Ba]|nr:hAT family dimerization protein [Ceratobasidium sp. AG-Ba]
MVRHLQEKIEGFFGERSYVRCLAHILNLMAKGFMLPFSRPSKRTKQVLYRTKIEESDKSSSKAIQEFSHVQQAETSAESEELDSPNSAEIDDSEFEHDTVVAQESVVKAIDQLYVRYKIAPTKQELQSAQDIMPKVAGLARRVDESTSLTISFHEAISLFPILKESGRKALSRRVPTRWGSDRHALDDHIHFRQPIQWLTAQPDLKLQRFTLEVFEVPTRHFSAGSIPLVHETLPKLVELKETIELMRDSSDISPITRVGAQAALNVYDKYMGNMSICEVYFIALVMCPDVKLSWLRKHYTSQSVERICQMVCARFHIVNQTTESKPTVPEKLTGKAPNRWIRPSTVSIHTNKDSIESYLEEDVVSLAGYGGLLPYCPWNVHFLSGPQVFTLYFCEATSVDVERAFSAGRLTINHLQHNMSSHTFEVKMALGSWYDTPLLPDIDQIASVVSEAM